MRTIPDRGQHLYRYYGAYSNRTRNALPLNDGSQTGVTVPVDLEAVVEADGRIGDVRILKGLDVGLDLNAIRCVREWRMEPARLAGEAVALWVNITVDFLGIAINGRAQSSHLRTT